MFGLNLQGKAAEEAFRQADEGETEKRFRYPSLYAVVDVILLCVLGALVYGLVRII